MTNQEIIIQADQTLEKIKDVRLLCDVMEGLHYQVNCVDCMWGTGDLPTDQDFLFIAKSLDQINDLIKKISQ